jgi:hypothetical protein
VLALRLHRTGDGWQAALGAVPQGATSAGGQLWLARYVDAQATDVRAGENRGVILRHDRVVRQLYGPWKFGTDAISQSVELPAGKAPWGLTAFVQDALGNVWQSLDLGVATCAAQTL